MMKYARHKMIAISVMITMLFASAAHAATLKSNVTVYSNVVTAKDLFENAGEFANEPLFLAPDIGSSGQISARRVAEEAHNVGLYDIHLNGIETVSVERPSRKITRQDVLGQLKNKLSKTLKNGIDFELVTTSIPRLTHADPRAEKGLQIEDLRLLENSKQFHATLHYSTYGATTKLPIRGSIVEMANVVVLTREVRRDDILSAGDFETARILKSRVKSGAVTSLAGLAGKALTRNLQSGAALREQDVIEPLIVRSNDPVSITYAIPGLLLTAQGRALESGPKDAVVSVRNLQSNRVIRARITDVGEVVVEPRKPLFAQTNSASSLEVQ